MNAVLMRLADVLDHLERKSELRSEGTTADLQPIMDMLNERLSSMTVQTAQVVGRRDTCSVCGKAIAQSKRGRPREYCSDRCRKVLFDAKVLLAHRQKFAVERNAELRSEVD